MTGNLSKADQIRGINRNLKKQSRPVLYIAAVLVSMEASNVWHDFSDETIEYAGHDFGKGSGCGAR